MDPIKDQLEAAGFTDIKAIRKGRWYIVTKNNETAAILYQHQSAWHWFSKEHRATASGSDAKNCDYGGLGDAIGDDADMRQYKRLINNAPEKMIIEFAGLYVASLQVYND